MDILSITPEGIEPQKGSKSRQGVEKANAISFKETMGKVINEVNTLQNKADESINNFATGDVGNIHEVMIAMQKAEMSFKFLMETRNKLVEAYREVSRMLS